MTWVRHRFLENGILMRGVGSLAVSIGLAACGGTTETIEIDAEASGGIPFVFSGGRSGSGGSGATGGEGSGGEDASGGDPGTGGMIYVEPECPDEAPPPPEEECDPLGEENECGEGFGCFPYLIYPNGEECGDPQFGSLCARAGQSEQGDPCSDGVNSCAGGYMCVLGAAGGTRCAKICKPALEHMCPNGLVCGATDVQGYGVCY